MAMVFNGRSSWEVVFFSFFICLVGSCRAQQNTIDTPAESHRISSGISALQLYEIPLIPTVRLEHCALVPGSVTVFLPRPENFLFHCDLSQGSARTFGGTTNPMEAELLVQAFAIDRGDSGPEQLLNAPHDGVLQWVLATGIMGPTAHSTCEGVITINDEEANFFCVAGRPQGMNALREALLLCLPAGSHNVVFVALYPSDDEERRFQALSLIRAARLLYTDDITQ